MATRRQFVVALGGALVSAAAGRALGQQGAETPGATMEGDGYVPVRRLPRSAAAKRLTPLEQDAVERNLSCPCPCTAGRSPRTPAPTRTSTEALVIAQQIADAVGAQNAVAGSGMKFHTTRST